MDEMTKNIYIPHICCMLGYDKLFGVNRKFEDKCHKIRHYNPIALRNAFLSAVGLTRDKEVPTCKHSL